MIFTDPVPKLSRYWNIISMQGLTQNGCVLSNLQESCEYIPVKEVYGKTMVAKITKTVHRNSYEL